MIYTRTCIKNALFQNCEKQVRSGWVPKGKGKKKVNSEKIRVKNDQEEELNGRDKCEK